MDVPRTDKASALRRGPAAAKEASDAAMEAWRAGLDETDLPAADQDEAESAWVTYVDAQAAYVDAGAACRDALAHWQAMVLRRNRDFVDLFEAHLEAREDR